jgi:hypothetical protein
LANWSKHIEDITGLPVFKRAKHGIHFQRPDGQIEASFSGKPCHHFADGIWKPIDTKLLPLGDGFYGCPHSPVKVHPDGRVAVTGTSYQQRAELPSAKTGLADNDRMIRQFSFGSQELRITEDGFKSEITLNRIPTLTEARKLIASESGTLSKEYLRSLTTATDANGDIHTYSTLSAFRTWLAQASFPVVIDPDFSETSAGGSINGVNATYSTARSTSTGSTQNNYPRIGQNKPGNFEVYRAFVYFDTSSIGAGSTVTQVNLKVKGYEKYITGSDFTMQVVEQDFSSLTIASNREAMYDGCLSGDTAGTLEYSFRGYGSSTNLTTSYVKKDGTTTYSIRSDRDYANTEPTGAEFLQYFIDNTGSLPILTVTYTAGGSIIPIVQYYNRLRRN